MSDDLDFSYAPEEPVQSSHDNHAWKILIVDDEQGIHDVTKLALRNVQFEERKLEFIHAYSGAEARTILQEHSGIAVAFIDVVMENDRAGLDLIHHIRDELKNKLIRIVLRTGQPGEAPERKVILDFDINDYKEKSELTSQKLFSTLLTSLRSYRDLESLEANRKGLHRVIESSSEMFRPKMLQGFIQGVLEQLIAVLNLDSNSLYGYCDSLAIEHSPNGNQVEVVAATGIFKNAIGENLDSQLPEEVTSAIREALESKSVVVRDNAYVGYFKPRSEREDVIYLRSNTTLSDDDADLVKLFLQNVAIAYENILLRDEIEGTQRDMVYMLGEAIETRSKETGNHVRRVAEYSYLIAKGIGLSEREAEILKVASPLHDFGKIGIPDSILHKPGKLEDAEFDIMKNHAAMGNQLLKRSEREILKSAAIVAGEHHEKWDGSGYPLGTKGEDIHVYGRIVAVADVFDALGSRRSYKEPWPLNEILALLERDKGSHFDPVIVDWVLENTDKMLEVMDQYPDPG
jgi:response regulator RpfG family c-di-GMP phosphodiesterase